MKYCPEIIEKLCKHLKQGSSIKSACGAVGINEDTFYEWQKKKPEFSEAIKKAKAIPDRKVENALFKSATMEHRYWEAETRGVVVGLKVKQIPVKRTRKVITPSVTAQIFWLKNRNPDEWKDKHEQEMSGEVKVKLTREIVKKEE